MHKIHLQKKSAQKKFHEKILHKIHPRKKIMHKKIWGKK